MIMNNSQSGQIFVVALVVLGFVLFNTLAIIGGSQTFFRDSNYSSDAVQALHLAEAGLDKAIAAMNIPGNTYSGELATPVDSLGEFDVVLTPQGSDILIESTGYVPTKSNPHSRRTVQILARRGAGAAFSYGVQSGRGGFYMSQTSQVNGSVYANGNITMENNTRINGYAFVAGGVSPTADQQTDCSTAGGCQDQIFGRNVSGSNIMDVAQSFQVSANNYISKIALNLRKVGSPPNVTVRILGNNGGRPDRGNVLATGTLVADLVTTSYGWIEVPFTTNPNLNAGTVYWIMIDTANDASNYWVWAKDQTGATYTNGQAAWSPNWSAGNPTWNMMMADFDFRVYLGGEATFIDGANGATVTGEAHANTLKDLTIQGEAYYQVASNITAAGYHPGSADPPSQPMPISDANIQAWIDAAMAINGTSPYSAVSGCPGSLSRGVYDGDVTININNCAVTVTDPIYITGDLNIDGNNVSLNLDPAYGPASAVIIVEGKISVSNGVTVAGSGSGSSMIMLLSRYDSTSSPDDAAIIVNTTGSLGILYAGNGTIDLRNGTALKEVTGWLVKLSNGLIINYDSGLALPIFTTGPTGGYEVVRGTYRIRTP